MYGGVYGTRYESTMHQLIALWIENSNLCRSMITHRMFNLLFYFILFLTPYRLEMNLPVSKDGSNRPIYMSVSLIILQCFSFSINRCVLIRNFMLESTSKHLGTMYQAIIFIQDPRHRKVTHLHSTNSNSTRSITSCLDTLWQHHPSHRKKQKINK